MKKNLLTGCLIISAAAVAGAQESRPNLVLFLADDCSHTDLGCYGSSDALTPRIDAFAREGMQFNSCYQSTPMSSPTRHNLFTGQWPMRTGAYPNHTFANEGTKSIVHHLHPLGYKVGIIGKLHISPQEVFPFDVQVGSCGDDLNFQEVEQFIRNNEASETPYCLLVTSRQPHLPYTKGDPSLFPPRLLTLPPVYYDTPETRREFSRYLAEVNYMDGEFGHLLDILEDSGSPENTVVVYLSEQGNGFPFAKWTCYEQGVGSACLVRWPGKVEAGSVSDALVEYVDILPTFVDLAGGKPVVALDGKSFSKVLLHGKKAHKKYTFSQQTTRGIINGSPYYGIRSVSDGRYRYILNLTPEAEFRNAAMKEPAFLSWEEAAARDPRAASLVQRYRKRPGVELYDVMADPWCEKNLATDPAFGTILKRLEKKLRAWMDYCGDRGQETEMEAFEHMKRNANHGRKSSNP